MKKNKGFTLIELLAVIIILAIIALITTPIILNVVNEARRDAAKDKAWGTIDAFKVAYAQDQAKEDAAVFKDGKIVVEFHPVTGDEKFAAQIGNTPIKMSGEVPQGGTVTMEEETGLITCDKLIFGKYSCTTNDGNKMNCVTENDKKTDEE